MSRQLRFGVSDVGLGASSSNYCVTRVFFFFQSKRLFLVYSGVEHARLSEFGFLELWVWAECLLASGMLLATMNKLTSSGSEAARRSPERPLSFAERVTYQRAVEEVYWHHRIWPKDNPQPKPPLDAIVSQAQLEKKVEDYLGVTELVANYQGWAIAASELQAEIDRMANQTKQPEVLRELFEALGNNPFVIAECLAGRSWPSGGCR